MTNSISYPIAKTSNGKWIHIDDAKHGYSYYCPECDRLHLISPISEWWQIRLIRLARMINSILCDVRYHDRCPIHNKAFKS